MRRIVRHRLAVGAAAVVLAGAAGGAAYAATQPTTRPPDAFFNDVARRLNVSPQRLTAAVKGAMADRLNAAVKHGRLTQAQANAIKQHIEHGGLPPFFFGPAPGALVHPPGVLGTPPALGHAGPLAAAASYLGLSDVQLFNDLRSGRSLAQIAKSKGKSVAGLEQALTATVKSRLDQAVAARRLTQSQEQQILSRFSSRVRDLVNGTGMRRGIEVPRGAPFMPPPWAHPRLLPPF